MKIWYAAKISLSETLDRAVRPCTVFQVREQLSRGESYATARRSDWESFDPQLIAESLFATANIFSILKLIHFCTISSQLGPLQLTLGRMVNDVLRFMVLALLVCFAFSCGVNQLYWYYSAEEIRTCEMQCNATHAEDCICDRALAEYVAYHCILLLYFVCYKSRRHVKYVLRLP